MGVEGVPWASTMPPDPCEWNDKESKAKFMNVVTFGARCLAQAQIPALDMKFQASCNLSQGLEEPYQVHREHSHQCELHCAEVLVPPAATWLLFAGQNLYQLCMANAKSGHTLNFTQQRWDEWKRKLCDISTDTKLDRSVCQLAFEAAKAMDQAVSTAQSL